MLKLTKLGIWVLAIAALFNSCTQGPINTAAAGSGSSGLDAAIGRCVATTVIGGIVGGVIGHYVGGQNGVGTGIALGAGAGAASCAVLTAINERDKEQIRRAQLAAAESGTSQIYSYQGDDGRLHQLSAAASAVPADAMPPLPEAEQERETTPPPKSLTSSSRVVKSAAPEASRSPSDERVCRYVDTTLEISGQGSTALPRELVCRTPDGDWRPEPVKSA